VSDADKPILFVYHSNQVLGLADRGQQIGGRGRASGSENDPPIHTDNHDFPINAIALGFHRVVAGSNFKALVDQQIEWKIVIVDKRLMAGGVSLVHTEDNGVESAKFVIDVAHGDELVRSATGIVAGVEDKQHAFASTEVTQTHIIALGPF
jgi:hypothetical protein